jgi:hypothetical protein
MHQEDQYCRCMGLVRSSVLMFYSFQQGMKGNLGFRGFVNIKPPYNNQEQSTTLAFAGGLLIGLLGASMCSQSVGRDKLQWPTRSPNRILSSPARPKLTPNKQTNKHKLGTLFPGLRT